MVRNSNFSMTKLYDDLTPIALLKLVLGDNHMDSYYTEWIVFKMRSFDDFSNNLDVQHRQIYLTLNANYNRI